MPPEGPVSDSSAVEDKPAAFPVTHWSVVLAARAGLDTEAQAALETLCRAYWYPLYTFVRRQGHTPEDAQDLTQDFFARLLEKEYLTAVDPAKGRFRSFLLTALKCFLADEYDKASAQKRGGGRILLSLDTQAAEERYQHEPVRNWMPERVFDRQWALALLEQARQRLRGEYFAAGKGDLFEKLKRYYDQGETAVAYSDTAAQLGLPENTVKSHVHRLRQRYRQLLREEITQTVSSPEDVEGEIRYLLEVVSGA